MADDSQISVKILNSEEVSERLKKLIESNENFKPILLTVEDPNAMFVEFGTRPARKTAGGGKNSKAYDRIRHWADNKSEVRRNTIRKRDSFAYRVYKDIMENGMIPQPFFRPAVHAMQEDLKTGSSRVKGRSTYYIAETLRNDMIDILHKNNTPYEFKIDQSITLREIRDANDVPPTTEIVSQDIMDSNTLDIMGRDRSGSRKWHAKRR